MPTPKIHTTNTTMSDLRKVEILERVLRVMPYPNQIHDIETEDDAIRFRWRSQHFQITTSLCVDTVGDGVLIGDDASILLAALIRL